MSRKNVIPHPGTYRRGIAQDMEACPRRLRFALQAGDISSGNVGTADLLGQAVHLVLHRYIETLRNERDSTGHGPEQMATQEAVELMYEVLAGCDLVLTAQDLDDLRWMVLGFCRHRWTTRRIMALEELLWWDIVCPDGVQRTATGRPDLIMYDGQAGIIICDYKSGRGRPPTPRELPPEGETITGREYLSDDGYFQLDWYGGLALTKWPKAQYATLRQIHLRYNEVREATISRADLEHVERKLGLKMQQIDRAIAEGPKSDLWRPRPGKQCARQCPVNRSCPIPREMRGIGAIETEPQARTAAKAYVVLDAQLKTLRGQIKTYFNETGKGLPIGDGRAIRYDGGKGGAMDIVDVDPPEPTEGERCPKCGKPSASPPAEVFCVDCATEGWEQDAKAFEQAAMTTEEAAA